LKTHSFILGFSSFSLLPHMLPPPLSPKFPRHLPPNTTTGHHLAAPPTTTNFRRPPRRPNVDHPADLSQPHAIWLPPAPSPPNPSHTALSPPTFRLCPPSTTSDTECHPPSATPTHRISSKSGNDTHHLRTGRPNATLGTRSEACFVKICSLQLIL
jgi:hypothetical protein